MTDANDSGTIDWCNPTTHMLAGQAAGRAESAETIEQLEGEIEALQAKMDRLQAIVDKLKSLLADWTDWQPGVGVKPPGKPGCGCCYCQKCGHLHDECVCEHNEIDQAVTAAEAAKENE